MGKNAACLPPRKSRLNYCCFIPSHPPFPLSPSVNCPTDSLIAEDRLPPRARIFLPPVLKADFEAAAAEGVHPAWSKIQHRGHHYIVTTNSLEDISEVADWARAWLVEPDKPLTKARRQAFQAVVNRAARWAELEPLGHCHCIATTWRSGKPRTKTVVNGQGKMKGET